MTLLIVFHIVLLMDINGPAVNQLIIVTLHQNMSLSNNNDVILRQSKQFLTLMLQVVGAFSLLMYGPLLLASCVFGYDG